MRLFQRIGSRLGLKLFISHLTIVLVGAGVLAAVARFHAPTALLHHVRSMEQLFGFNQRIVNDLSRSFLAAVDEILLVEGLSATVAALLVSLFVSWRITVPIRALREASTRLAEGHYGDRVVTGRQDELGALAESFNRLAGALDQTERRRMELIGNVAHELRTPLTGIRSMTEGLMDGVLAANTETFTDIHKEALRLQRLVEDSSELSRAEAGTLSVKFERAEIGEVLEEAVSRLGPSFDKKGVALHSEIGKHPFPVMMDRERILQVFTNLLANALHYTPAGGTVAVRCHQTGSSVVVRIRDTGIGISSEDLPHLFDRFYRVDKSRSRTGGGSGIGLTIAMHLVDVHGGSLEAESPGPGKGSTFTVTLPVAGSGARVADAQGR